MQQLPPIKPAERPGPDYDPMDRIIEDLENVESFLTYFATNPMDLDYLNTHLSGILALRRTLSHQLEMLSEEPYNYHRSRLKALHDENEKIFLFLEGAVGASGPWDEVMFKKSVQSAEEALSKFDAILTP